jgi:hypothetical protein
MIKNKDPWFLLFSQLWMGRRTYYFLLLKIMLTSSLMPLAFCSTYPNPYILSATIDYKSYCWVNWFKARFSGSWLRSWSFRFLRNLSFASLFYQCIVSSHIGSFANLAGYPPFKPTSSFMLTFSTYLSLEYGDNTSQKGASKGRFKFPLIKTSGTYLNPTFSLLGDEQMSKHGGWGRYYAN